MTAKTIIWGNSDRNGVSISNHPVPVWFDQIWNFILRFSSETFKRPQPPLRNYGLVVGPLEVPQNLEVAAATKWGLGRIAAPAGGSGLGTHLRKNSTPPTSWEL